MILTEAKNSPLAWIICESYPEESHTEVKYTGFNGKAVAEVILQTADEKNRNGRFYSLEELTRGISDARLQELLMTRTLFAECGHPLTKDLQRQATIDKTNACASIEKVWMEGCNVKALVTASNHPIYGVDFDLDLKEGRKPAWSLRALGAVTETRRGAEVNNLKIITWDSVIYPSHPGAYTQRVLTAANNESTALVESALLSESGDLKAVCESTMEPMVTIVEREDIVKYIMEESSKLKFLRECFDFIYDDISVNEAGTRVTLSEKNGDTIIVPLETHIHNELMNFASKQMDLYN